MQVAAQAKQLRHHALRSGDTLWIEKIDTLPIKLVHDISLIGAHTPVPA